MKPKIELKPNQTIVFTGDSITDAQRENPAYNPFGFGYVSFTANILLARYPHLNLNIINTGVSGNTIRDLKNRWRQDCIIYKPDVLSVLIGINDVCRQYQPEKIDGAVYIDEYKSTYSLLLSQVRKECGSRLILIEPFMFCSSQQNPAFKMLDAYIDVVKTLAEEFKAVLVPLQSLVNETIKEVPAERWSDDMVHPYVWAHAWISQQWIEKTGL
ncbi:MAG: SGNH/GDSL hydrolase family protein [Planctomycetota bacterium]|jgi:lysophospholipase L1-like esterase